MKLCMLLILAVFASENENAENDPKYEESPILVKIEEDENAAVIKKSKFIGVTYNKMNSKWKVQRCSKNKVAFNGYYDDEELAAHASDTLARKLMENGGLRHKFNFFDNYTEVYPQKDRGATSKYFGVSYHKKESKWFAQRWSKHENKTLHNGYYDDEETAAHASDTLARNLIEKGELNHKLNFPDDYTEVYPEKDTEATSKFFGVAYNKLGSNWSAQRWSKHENKLVYYGYYDDEETAAHASDTLARKLMGNGEKKLKLNFSNDYTEVYWEKKNPTSKYIGVSYEKNESKWRVQRWLKNKKTSNKYYDDEQTAAHASDTLARKLMENGEQKLKLNFPDDNTEVYRDNQKKRKRPNGFEHNQNN